MKGTCDVYINIIHLEAYFLCWILNISPHPPLRQGVCVPYGSQLSPVQGHLTSNDDMRGAEWTKGQTSCLKVGTICSTSHVTEVFVGSGQSTSPAETTTLLSLFLPPRFASITSLLLSMLPPQITHTQILIIPSASSKPHS